MNILLHLIKYIVKIGGINCCDFFLSLPAFLQGGVDQKLQKHWQAQKNQKFQKALVTKPWQAQKNKNIKSVRIYGGSGMCIIFFNFLSLPVCLQGGVYKNF